MIVSSGEARPIAVSESSHRQLRVGTTEPTSGEAQAEGRPLPDRDEMDFQYGCGVSLGLISPSPPHGQDTRGCHHSAGMTGGWRLTTFGVSGLYSCRRLTYRGACRSILAPLSMLVKHGGGQFARRRG